MTGILNSIVFQPPNKESDILFTYLCRAKRYMSHVTMPTGECLYYIHIQYNQSGVNHDCTSACTGNTTDNSSQNSAAVHTRSSPRVQDNLVILYSHGNAENLGICYSILRWLSLALHMDIIGYDYRGYGFSKDPREKTPFEPTESSVYADADCIYEQALALGYHPSQIILMGRSLGGGPACYLAEKHHKSIAGLILESTFSSCIRVVSPSILPFCFGWLDMFVNVDRIKNITECPILFMHGKRDNVVPIRCSELLLSIAIKKRQSLRREQVQTKRSFLSCLSCASVGVSNPVSEQKRRRPFSPKPNGDQDVTMNSKYGKEEYEIRTTCNTVETIKVVDRHLQSVRFAEPLNLEVSCARITLPVIAGNDDNIRSMSNTCEVKIQGKRNPLSKDTHLGSYKTLDHKRGDHSKGSSHQANGVISEVASSVVTTPVGVPDAYTRADTFSPQALPDSLEEGYRMLLDAAGSAVTKTKEEKMGIFYHWFEDCGHNDIETRSSELFFLTLNRFIKYVAELKKAKERGSGQNSPFHVDVEERKCIPRF